MSIVLDDDVFRAIRMIVEEEKLRSFSLAANRLLREALDKYPDPDEPGLPFTSDRS